MLVEALTDHAGSVREADRKFRSFYGLEAPADAPALAESRDDRTPTAPPADTGDSAETPATEPDADHARGNGRIRKHARA